MDLGEGKLRRNGLNSLKGAIHAKHGLAWTDGKSVFLAPVNIVDDEVESNTSLKLGEFDHVQSLHWSSEVPGSVCYLCVVHNNTVTLWKVGGAALNLTFKQVRKINASPIPQGCLWNPRRDLICILNKDQCSFYFKHSQNKGNYAFPPIESGKISCGCWCPDGKKLIIGIGSILLIYQWLDIDKSISEYTITAWKIPNVDGKVMSVMALSNSQLICTAELPLESLVTANQNFFDVNDLLNGDGDSSSLENENADIQIIKPKKGDGTTNKDSLLNLRRNDGCRSDYSQLILFELQSKMMEPSKLTSITLKGILSPDLLYCRMDELVIVGSNSQNLLQVFKVNQASLNKIHEIRLMTDERPKGIWGVPSHIYTHSEGMLVMIGKLPSTDNTFLPPSIETSYQLSLRHIAVVQGAHHPAVNPSASSILPRPSTPHTTLSSGAAENSQHEICLPSGDKPVNLVRFNPIGGDNLESIIRHNPNGSPDNRLDTAPKIPPRKSPSTSSSQADSPRINLHFPGSLPKENKAHAKKILCLGEDQSADLELERADFEDTVPQFQNNFGFDRMSLRDKQGVPLSDSEEDFITKFNSRQNDTKPNGQMTKSNNLSSPVLYSEDSSLNYRRGDRSLMKSALVPPPEASYPGEGHITPADSIRISILEEQIKTQNDQFTLLHNQMETLSRSMEKVISTKKTSNKLLSEVEVVHFVLRSDEQGDVKKTFILDRGMVQLGPIKEAFSLTTVEIITGDMSCVVGANPEGYIPIMFQNQQTVYITGLRPTEIPAPQSFC